MLFVIVLFICTICTAYTTVGEVVTLRAAREAEGTWTTSDAVNFKDLCEKTRDR